MNQYLHIRARQAVADQDEIQPSGFFGELQWMPPGKNAISASVNGKPKKINVVATSETASLVDKRIKEMIADGDSGKANARPFLDFDHTGGEASALVLGASWGGSDPLKGGVRLKVEWTEIGRAKVRGKSYSGFSPEFFVNPEGEVVNVSCNLGGLCNLPAFVGIARVKAAASTEDRNQYIGALVEDKTENEFMVRAAQLQTERGIKDINSACLILAREQPALYQTYNDGLCQRPAKVVTARAAETEEHPLLVQAKSRAKKRGLSMADALIHECRANPDAYEDYRLNFGRKPEDRVTVKASRQPSRTEPELMIRARAMAEAQDIPITEAALVLARANPQMYDEYCVQLHLCEKPKTSTTSP